MSETYLKPSQTSKMKLLAKVVNTSRDVFRKECQLLHLVVPGKCFTQYIYFSKNISFDIQRHVLPGIKFITDLQELNI